MKTLSTRFQRLRRLLIGCGWFAVLGTASLAGTITFTHNPAGRLTAAAYDSGKSIAYTYDFAGNVTQRQFSLGGADTDGDGMDDAWELLYFGNLSRNGTGDFDGDGFTDLAEFLAGTLPNDPNSVFRILPNPTVNGGGTTVQWQSISGRTYRLQFKNSLTNTNWTDVAGDVIASGTTASKTDSSAVGQPIRFYRVKLVP